MTRVVLGSASPGRLKVLRQAGIDPIVVVSAVDEDAVVAGLGQDVPPEHVVCTLAEAKAADVVGRLPADAAGDCVVIGCDSMLYLDGRLCGKPVSIEAARRQWQGMAGRSADLYTGHCAVLVREGEMRRTEVESAITTVHFGDPTANDLTAYLNSGEPLNVAGGFTLDGLGGWFVEAVTGDPSTVIGLGLPLTRRLFARVGLSLPELWAANSL